MRSDLIDRFLACRRGEACPRRGGGGESEQRGTATAAESTRTRGIQGKPDHVDSTSLQNEKGANG